MAKIKTKEKELLLPDKAELFILWIETQKNMSPATVRAYRTDLYDFNVFLESKLNKNLNLLSTINKKDVQLYLAKLHNEDYAKSSISRKLSSLRAFFNYALRKKIIENSPLANIKNPKQPKYHPNVPSKNQVLHILDSSEKKIIKEETLVEDVRKSNSLENSEKIEKKEKKEKNVDKLNPKKIATFARDLALIELLYGSGLRISEALNLNLSDFSKEKSSILVLGKGSKQRFVPLTEASIYALENWIKLLSSLQENKPNSRTQALFIGTRGGRLNRREALRIIEKLQKQEGTPHLTAHSFRHAYATHLLESGLDLRTVQELLGHARIATTQIYTHLNLTHLIEVYKNAHPEENK